MALSDQQRADIQRQFDRGDHLTGTLMPLFCGVALVVALVGFVAGSDALLRIGLAVALTMIALTVVGAAMKTWLRRRI